MATTAEEIQKLLERLPQRDQERVLNYTRSLVSAEPFPRTPLPPVRRALLSPA